MVEETIGELFDSLDLGESTYRMHAGRHFRITRPKIEHDSLVDESPTYTFEDEKSLSVKDRWVLAGRPCHDPQCNDSTWDHPCPVPPSGVNDD